MKSYLGTVTIVYYIFCYYEFFSDTVCMDGLYNRLHLLWRNKLITCQSIVDNFTKETFPW